MALTRVARTARALLTHVFYDLDGETPITATGDVTVAVVDANGETVATGTATAGGTGSYTWTLPAQAQLCELTVSWTAVLDGTTVVEQDQVEVAGGFFFTVAGGRGQDASLANASTYTTADLLTTRTEVEQECEEICAQAFVPRYRRVVLDGSGTSELVLPDPNVRTIRAVRVAARADRVFTALTTDQLAALVERGDRVLHRVDGNIWTEGYGNVVVEYEHGLDAPPTDLVRAAKLRLRIRMNTEKTRVPDRAVSFQSANGGDYKLATATKYTTGIPDVDAVYERYSLRPKTGQQGGAAARTLTYAPQRHSLFHRGDY
jgi:hypothetical protein